MVELPTFSHVDLFSGIGCFSLASYWAGFQTVVFCEKDQFCQKVLKKHWPDVPIVDDIKEFNGKRYTGATLLTGGVPCQPASCAGKQQGTEDDRWLWPEAFRVIKDSQPKWVILENVRGLVSLNGGVEFENLLLELETINYETRSFVIPACGVDAPHKRDRVWIVANTSELYSNGSNNNSRVSQQSKQISKLGNSSRETVVADTQSIRLSNGNDSKLFGQATRKVYTPTGTSSNSGTMEAWEWETDTGICRISDGCTNRIHRLRSLGNAIVPQVAFEFIRSIKIIESQI